MLHHISEVLFCKVLAISLISFENVQSSEKMWKTVSRRSFQHAAKGLCSLGIIFCTSAPFSFWRTISWLKFKGYGWCYFLFNKINDCPEETKTNNWFAYQQVSLILTWHDIACVSVPQHSISTLRLVCFKKSTGFLFCRCHNHWQLQQATRPFSPNFKTEKFTLQE